MKLTRKEAEKIAKNYNLGKIKEIKPIERGMLNYNFTLKTNKGAFIIRILGQKYRLWLRDRRQLMHEVTEFLINEKFPYQIPNYRKNIHGNFVSRINGKHIEVYEKIPGKNRINVNRKQHNEIIKMVATYHKYVSNFKIKKKFGWIDNSKWILGRYKILRKVKPKNKTDKLMLKNLDSFENLLKKALKYDLNKSPLIAHSDFNKWNLLWKGDKLTGIIDFENLAHRPRAFDLAYIWKGEVKLSTLVKEYKKHNSLSKTEENNLIIFKIIQACNTFWWSYLGMKKRPEQRYKWIQRSIRNRDRFSKMWKETK
ncbi:MAG: hypothetical protein CL811_04690 [Colwelliaceae bacterium]|nr:hypothetical protein [Colwelliaceae bacterium]|tara:strand:+ start:1394 stop:2326 length:933 start_codon:yes stop_codon:yes gene_type:complete